MSGLSGAPSVLDYPKRQRKVRGLPPIASTIITKRPLRLYDAARGQGSGKELGVGQGRT